jgi:hypothetical protein
MKRIALMFALVSCFLLVSTTVPVSTTFAVGEPQFVFCYSASINPDLHQWFYSDIFRGDPATRRKFSDAFWRYLQDTYPDRNTGPAGCRFYTSEYSANSDKRTLKAASNADSIETHWSY